jgi:4-aminobutyrate--pyruvate transaminase
MNTLANSAAARDKAFTLHPYANLRALERSESLVVSSGNGVFVYDDEGNEYLESVAGLWSASLGFGGEPRLVEAARKAMERLPFYHQFGPKAHEPGIELAAKLVEKAPVPMSKAFFCCSGSEANDTVVKLVWYYNNVRGRAKKKKIISRHRAYHGVTVAAASLTGLPHNHRLFDLPIPNILHTHCPHHYREALPGESEEAFVDRITGDLEDLILKEGPDTIAAFIAEPINGAGGVVVPPAGYFERVQAILRKYDILFSVDEVITGFGRTGNYWGSQTFDLKPDILVCAKMLSASYLPLAAVMVSEEIYQAVADGSDAIGTFGHGFTYGGHPVACAVALETLAIYDERDIIGHVRDVAPYFQSRLREAFAGHPLVGEVRGVGLVTGIELVRDKATKEPFERSMGVAAHAVSRAQHHRMISRAVGDTLCVSPPLIVTREVIDEIVRRLSLALEETAGSLEERAAWRPGPRA